MSDKRNKVLVTGGTGLLGSHLLLDLIQKNYRVKALFRTEIAKELTKKIFQYYFPSENFYSLIEWVKGDLLDVLSLEEAMEAVDQVYHCAALVSFASKDRYELFRINQEGTANVVNVCLSRKIKKLCHVSSIAALGRQDNTGLVDEQSVWKDSPSNSNYSVSKYASEREVWRGAEEGLEVVIINPSIIIGPGDWNKGSSKMFSASYKGMRYYAEGVSGFVDVRDVTKCMILLMESSVVKERFVVSSENIGFQDFFARVHKEFNKPVPSIKAGRFLTELAWRVDTFKSFMTGTMPLITKESARSAHEKHYFCCEKIKNTIQFEFISSDKMIQDTCRAFLGGTL